MNLAVEQADAVAMPSGPVDDPAGWSAADMQRRTDWIYPLTGEDIAELEAALARTRQAGRQLIEIRRDDFPLPTLGEKLARIRKDVVHGRGFALIRGLPVKDRPRLDVATFYWGIGLHLGFPVCQNAKGHLLGHVIDLGEVAESLPTIRGANHNAVFNHSETRGYNSRARFFFHTDAADIVGLCCLHAAKSGGRSLIVSSIALHNEIMKRRPDLLRVLYEPFFITARKEQPAGNRPWFQMPAFTYFQGKLTCQFVPLHVQNAQRLYPEIPRLTDAQREALDLMEALAEDDAFQVRMDLEQGDIQFLHNHVVQHTRTAYEDFPEADRRRHLLRLWLVTPDGRPLDHWFYDRYGAGRRGGVYPPGVSEIASLEP